MNSFLKNSFGLVILTLSIVSTTAVEAAIVESGSPVCLYPTKYVTSASVWTTAVPRATLTGVTFLLVDQNGVETTLVSVPNQSVPALQVVMDSAASGKKMVYLQWFVDSSTGVRTFKYMQPSPNGASCQ